jgi:hypothetical protein
MDLNDVPRDSNRDTYMAIIICTAAGVPLFVFLNIVTAGLFIYCFLAIGVIAMFGAVHYFLWGRSFTEKIAGEREEAELQEQTEDWPYVDDPP